MQKTKEIDLAKIHIEPVKLDITKVEEEEEWYQVFVTVNFEDVGIQQKIMLEYANFIYTGGDIKAMPFTLKSIRRVKKDKILFFFYSSLLLF